MFGDLSGCGFGAFADFVCAPERALTRTPPNLNWVEPAAVPQAGTLAAMALRAHEPLHPQQSVLVNGAGGGVGTFAVQIAAASGAEVTGVDTAAKLDTVKAAGAKQVIDYTHTDFTRTGLTYDRIVEPVTRQSPAAYRRALRARGVCAIVGGTLPRIGAALLIGSSTNSLSGRRVLVPLWQPDNPTDMAFLSGLLEAGTITPIVDQVLPLAQAAPALARFGASGHIGPRTAGQGIPPGVTTLPTVMFFAFRSSPQSAGPTNVNGVKCRSGSGTAHTLAQVADTYSAPTAPAVPTLDGNPVSSAQRLPVPRPVRIPTRVGPTSRRSWNPATDRRSDLLRRT